MRLGVAWYPEQHPRDRWRDDVRRMADAGLELVRLGEFAWARIEPARGRYELDWLDEAVEVAAAAGLNVVLGTPTAVPPVWLALERPEILSVGIDGRRRPYGGRKFTCPTHPAYREESRRITSVLVERYGGHPAVVAWQLDNEPGNHESAWCWDDSCETAFRGWLEARYGTIDALNAAWGTVFWSGTYPSFEAVRLPRTPVAAHNPSLLLAHRRFASDQVVAGIAEQLELVRAGAPDRDVFSNVSAREVNIDPRALARELGAAAISLYPTGMGDLDDGAFLLDLARGHTGRAWVMEHQPGRINWTPTADPVPPGQVRLWAWRAALHGLEAVLFFSWRPTRSGSEQYHAGLLRHDGSPDRGLAEVTRLASELRAIEPALLRRPKAPVALLWSVDDHWAIELDPHRPGLTHRSLVVAAYGAALRLGLEIDIVAPDDDLADYPVVLAPALQLRTAGRIAALEAALRAGALVVLGPRSLVKDVDDCWLEEPIPGGLSERLGAQVVESVAPDAVTLDPWAAPAGPWIDVLEVTGGAEVVARFGGSSYLAGQPAVVARDGLAYVGCSSPEGWLAVLRTLLDGRVPLMDVDPSCERFIRDGRVLELDHAALEVTGLDLTTLVVAPPRPRTPGGGPATA